MTYVPASFTKAAELPAGSVVANESQAYIKNNPTDYAAWSGTDGSHVPDALMDLALGSGAIVLRRSLP